MEKITQTIKLNSKQIAFFVGLLLVVYTASLVNTRLIFAITRLMAVTMLIVLGAILVYAGAASESVSRRREQLSQATLWIGLTLLSFGLGGLPLAFLIKGTPIYNAIASTISASAFIAVYHTIKIIKITRNGNSNV